MRNALAGSVGKGNLGDPAHTERQPSHIRTMSVFNMRIKVLGIPESTPFCIVLKK